MTQHSQNPRPKSKHQKSTKRSVEGANVPGLPGFLCFRATFRFPVRFFCLYNRLYLDTLR